MTTLDEEIVAARQALTDLGYVEDSGERRPDRDGVLQPVYQLTTLGRRADVYLRQGFTFEEAISLARAANSERES